MLAAASGIKIVASILAILTIGFIVLSFFPLNHNRKADKGRKKKQGQQELTVRRIDVGSSVEKESDVDEFLIAQTQEEKVTFSKTVKILLVEDNQINMDVAQYMLEEEGIYVHLAKDGKEAVEQFEKLPAEEIDLILMDVMMPGMDGIEATKLIRSSSKENAGTIPIIALTASRNEEDIQRTKEAGMNEYLNKPFDIDATLEVINKYVK
ncbi:MAG: response regulator [Lachnospiraceae bacterium]|nr:response regulator [Lachnospiraceae bacterium]